MQCDDWTGEDLPPLQVEEGYPYIWGDGSVNNSDHFFSKSYGFAIVGSDGLLIYKAGFHDPLASSFKAELCALIAAIRTRGPRIHFVTDCKSLMKVFDKISGLGYVPSNIAFAHWWMEIFASCGFGDACELRMIWIRAHLFDHAHGLVPLIYRLNRLVDGFAKQAAAEASPISTQTVKSWKQLVFTHQAWLCRLMKLISSMKSGSAPVVDDDNEGEIPQDAMISEDLELQRRFHSWDWHCPVELFDWQSAETVGDQPPKWKFHSRFWQFSCNFFLALKWKVGEDHQMSIYRLAYQFWRMSPMTPHAVDQKKSGSFLNIVEWLRYCLKQFQDAGKQFLPPSVKYDGRKIFCCNGYYPKGTFVGGTAFMNREDMFHFARFLKLHPSASRSSASWDFSLATIS